MKSLLVLPFLVTLAFGQEAVCRCGAFVSTSEAEVEVLKFPNIQLADCTQTNYCAQTCKAEWERITNDGDLCSVKPDGDTVAQRMCNNLADLGKENLQPHSVYLYYNVCGGPWLFDGQISRQELECRNTLAVVEC
ncbi:uncharacterized protein LOC127004300 [Eriocheir sinensis]|uniref:uncharacterized protein LOC127004300 n=1 Tax=Eriocheir sinensis TaxID=95602 RepID=UPI0021CA7C9B|nr:uncharacterized protein LOC127004300 [Eriocheir sinensis]